MSATQKGARFTFGKYRGLSVEDVIKFNPDYVLWAAENLSTFVLPPDVKRGCLNEARRREQDSLTRQDAWCHGFGAGAKRAAERARAADYDAETKARLAVGQDLKRDAFGKLVWFTPNPRPTTPEASHDR